MNLQCIHCAGKGMCGRSFCPIQQKIYSQAKLNTEFKKDYFGATPNIFVGRVGYPRVNMGLLSNENISEEYDNPKLWSSENYQIQKLIDLRSSLVNSRFKVTVKSFDDKFVEMSQEVTQSSKPVDVEISLNKKPGFKLSYDQQVAPFGPSVKLEKAEITENPKIPVHVDKIVAQTDLKAVDAMSYLYKKGFDEHYLTKLISAGNLGTKINRKITPTRWSITATDDILGKELIKQIKTFKEYDYVAHFGGYLGNHYLILFFPEIWRYELFETMVATKESSTDYESYSGRKDYADNTVGGYYAARLSILEYLNNKKRQASVLALRFVSDEYWAPLGVWVVRESVRKSLRSSPLVFSLRELMTSYAVKLLKKKFNYNADLILSKSILLREVNQPKLTNF